VFKIISNKIETLIQESEPENYVLPDLSAGEGGDNEHLFFSVEDVVKSISNIKRSKAQGHDEIPGLVIKDLSQTISEPLCWLFNTILTTGRIPKAWKISRVTPIHKKGNKTNIENYRPISNNSTLSKVFEKCLIKKLGEIKDFDTLMGVHQHAYRADCSTVTACIALHDHIATELDAGKNVVLYSTDLSSAFDLLRPGLLIKNLIDLGMPRALIRVMLDFLSNRTSYVQVGNHSSYTKYLQAGCVQGSVLGPYLFNIYTRELKKIIEGISPECFVVAYADDCYVFLSTGSNNPLDTLSILEQIFVTHANWLSTLSMVCNFKKTELIVFAKIRHVAH